MSEPDASLLDRVARSLSAPAEAKDGGARSVFSAAAAYYGAKPDDEELTSPTGFDPAAAALFESVVEAAYLVALADGHFDDDERHAFVTVVHRASGKGISEQQIEALLADLAEQSEEDGLDKRLEMIGRTVQKPEHRHEVLRIAALLAQVSGGVSDEERQVLDKLAVAVGLEANDVTTAIEEATRAVSG